MKYLYRITYVDDTDVEAKVISVTDVDCEIDIDEIDKNDIDTMMYDGFVGRDSQSWDGDYTLTILVFNLEKYYRFENGGGIFKEAIRDFRLGKLLVDN